MPKSSKNTKSKSSSVKSKSFVGTVKRQSKAKLAFLGFAVILLLTTLGYVGFSAYKVNSLNAKAAGYTVIRHDAGNGFMIRACKIYTRYGYNLRLVFNKPASTSSGSKAHSEIFSGKKYLTGRTSQSWWGNQITVIDTPAGSGNNNFRASIYTSEFYDPRVGGDTVWRMANC